MLTPTSTTIISHFQQLQDNICASLEALDGKSKFQEDKWEREEGGGGRTRIIQGGDLIEKGGVNFSAVHGKMPEKICKALQLPNCQFLATGVSIVLHPRNPHMPIIHMNVRYFDTDADRWWFGGGIDLTPHYVYPEDVTFFHQSLQKICNNHDSSYFPAFKKWADDYFYIPHRQETRGVGGIFFNHLSKDETHSFDSRYAFVKEVGDGFVPIYSFLAKKHKNKPFTKEEQKWQFLRRSRYVEFNLVYDIGTKFGLDTNGRTESILMSLPPMAAWGYHVQPNKGSAEAYTQSMLKKGIDWASG